MADALKPNIVSILTIFILWASDTSAQLQSPVLSLTTTGTSSSTYSGQKAVTQAEVFQFNYTIALNGTRPSSFQLVIELTLPHVEEEIFSGCKTYLDNNNICDGTTTNMIPSLDMDHVDRTLEVFATPGVVLQRMIKLINKNVVTYDFGTVNVPQDANPFIEVFFNCNFTIDAEESRENPFSFDGKTIETIGGQDFFTNVSTAYYILRPILGFSGSTSDILSSGTTATVSITLRHLSISTSTATGVSVSITLENTEIATYNNDATVKKNSGATSSIGDLSSAISGVTLLKSDTYTFSWTLTAVNLPLLGTAAKTRLTVTYDKPSGGGEQFSNYYVFRHKTPSITFSTGVDDVSLPSILQPDASYEIRNTFTVPKGILKNFAFTADFSSTTISPIPVEMDSSELTSSSGSLVFSDPSKTSASSGDFTINRGRKKRSFLRIKRATSSYTARHAAGTITSQGPGSANVLLKVKLNILNPTVGGTLQKSNTYVTFHGVNYFITAGTGTMTKPLIELEKVAQIVDASVMPAIVEFTVDAKHAALSNGPAYSLELQGGNDYFDVFWSTSLVGPSLSALTITDSRKFSWPIGTFAIGRTNSIKYRAKIDINAANLPDGDTWINATVTYKSAAPSTGTYTTDAACCVTKVANVTSTLFTNYGFTAMAVIFGLLLGLLIVVLVFFILIKCCRRIPFGSKEEDAVFERSHALAVDGGLVTDSKMAKQGLFNAKDVEKSMGDTMTDSIVYILAQPDQMKVHRELDDRDIKSTIFVDTKLEEERDDAMKKATIQLMMGLKSNGDLPQETVDKCVKNFKKKAHDLDKKTEDDFRQDLEAAYRRRSAKNRESLADLLGRQEEEEEELMEKTANMDPKEKDEIIKLTKKKHETEKNELMYGLKLEQEEETETIRKEHSIRKRMGLKELQQETLDDVIKNGKLTAQQADWLMKEYLHNQAGVEKIFDEEIARQRMQLEEKLARRRELAQRAEIQDDHQAELLNTMANQQRQAVNKLKKDGTLSPEEAQVLLDAAHDEMMEAKGRMDLERSRHEADLQQKLSERKRKKMQEEMKRQESERADLAKKHQQSQADGYVPPLEHIDEEQKLLTMHRQEMNQIEIDIDNDHAEELLKLRDNLVQDVTVEINASNDKLLRKLHEEGMSEDQANKIIAKHKKEMVKLNEAHAEEKEKQQRHFEKALKRRRSKYNAQREEEQKEQEQLREQEEKVVRNLISNHVAISETERDRIMKEHEKQMVTLENSLTLNKLRQKNMLENRLAKRRAEQLERLQKKQQQESKKAARQMDVDSDMDEDERHHQELNLMKRHAQQTIIILQGEQIEMDKELDGVKDEMLKDRAAALEEQEVKLGAMLAKLQLEKANEKALIEVQGKAILDLKLNLMDDLSARGVLSNPECQKVIDIHNKEQEKLRRTLDEQRSKQEKRLKSALHKRLNQKEEILFEQQKQEMESTGQDEALRKRLNDRLAQKEANLANMQEKQLNDLSAEGNTTAARLRRVALKQKHFLEMEQFRNRVEKEITQTLEEDRRQYDMRRAKDMQNQELQFINGLVRLGTFKMSELENVVSMLFPLKSEAERKELLDQLTEGYKARADSPSEAQDETDGRRRDDGTLLERIKSAKYERAVSATLRSARGKKPGGKSILGNKKKLRFVPEDGSDKVGLLSTRPDPLGRSNSPGYESDEGRQRRGPPGRLPPLSKKKKLKFDDTDSYRY